MVLSNEKAEKLLKYLTDDLERAKKLFALPLAEAANVIRLDGLEYSEKDLIEFVEYIRQSISKDNDELAESELEDATGGLEAKIRACFGVIFMSASNNFKCEWI